MIFLRCISFLIGALLVMGAPFFLLPARPQQFSEIETVVTACITIAMLASGFFYIAFAGHHMKRSRRARTLAGILLGLPIFGSIAALLLEAPLDDIWIVFPLFCCAGFMFVSFVYPAKHQRTHTRMRPRDPDDIVQR